MEQQMREGAASQSHAEVVHMGEVGLGQTTRQMDLLENDIALGTVERTPLGDMTLKGTQLASRIAVRMVFTEHSKEGFGLQGRVSLKLGFDPGPVSLERIGVGQIGTR